MANTRLGNTFYIDTQYSTSAHELTSSDLKVTDVIITPTAANAILTLQDSSHGIKIAVRAATSGQSEHFSFSEPIRFSTSIRPTVLTNCVAFVVFKSK